LKAWPKHKASRIIAKIKKIKRQRSVDEERGKKAPYLQKVAKPGCERRRIEKKRNLHRSFPPKGVGQTVHWKEKREEGKS